MISATFTISNEQLAVSNGAPNRQLQIANLLLIANRQLFISGLDI